MNDYISFLNQEAKHLVCTIGIVLILILLLAILYTIVEFIRKQSKNGRGGEIMTVKLQGFVNNNEDITINVKEDMTEQEREEFELIKGELDSLLYSVAMRKIHSIERR